MEFIDAHKKERYLEFFGATKSEAEGQSQLGGAE
jgi:hypothetical protein